MVFSVMILISVCVVSVLLHFNYCLVGDFLQKFLLFEGIKTNK